MTVFTRAFHRSRPQPNTLTPQHFNSRLINIHFNTVVLLRLGLQVALTSQALHFYLYIYIYIYIHIFI